MKKVVTIFTVTVLAVVLTVTASAKTVKLGDVNGDGRITASDARSILRFAATLDTYDEELLKIADVDLNNKVTASDARKVLRVAAALEADLGEITIGEEDATAEPVERTEIKDGIGMTVTNFIKTYGGMTKDGTSDGTTMYHNNDLIIVSDPAMIDDLKINSITVISGDYTINGIYAGMSSDEATAMLINDGWKFSTSNGSGAEYTKHSDIMKLTVRNDTVTQAELCLAVSIATQQPAETTTQEPVTSVTPSEPTTQPSETTTQTPEETTQADYIPVDELPEGIRSFINGSFGFKGTVYNSDGQPNHVTLYTDSTNISISMSMSMSDASIVNVKVLIVDEGKDEPNMYMVNSDKGTYSRFSPLLFGMSVDSFKVGMNAGDIDSIRMRTQTVTEDDIEYLVYYTVTDSGTTYFYTLNDEIKRVASFDVNGSQISKIDVEEFYPSFSDDVFSYSQYTNVYHYLALFV